MMVHTQYNYLKKILIIVLLFTLCFSCSLSVSAVDKGSYSGKYDLLKEHKVNQHYDLHKNICDNEYLDNVMAICYQQLRAWDLSPEGAAAVVGNFKAEGWAPDNTQDWVSWDNFVFGTTGIGIAGFTYYSIQQRLFDIAYEEGKSWTDLGVQLKVFKETYIPLEDMYYSPGGSVRDLAVHFCDNHERPQEGYENYDKRISGALYYYNLFKDYPKKDYDGSLSVEEIDYSETDVETANFITITEECDLKGMPTKSGLTADLQLPSLVGRDSLTTAEQYNLAQIGQSVAEAKEFNAWTTARTVLVFIGLMLMAYTFILALCTLFDTVNSFLNISLVKLITLGAINYSNYDYKVLDGEDVKYTSGKRMVILLIVMFVIGCIFVSGGVLPFVMQSIHSAMETVSSWV